jgi:hypothetical protein
MNDNWKGGCGLGYSDAPRQEEAPLNLSVVDPKYIKRWKPKNFLSGGFLATTDKQDAQKCTSSENASALSDSADFYRTLLGGKDNNTSAWSRIGQQTESSNDNRLDTFLKRGTPPGSPQTESNHGTPPGTPPEESPPQSTTVSIKRVRQQYGNADWRSEERKEEEEEIDVAGSGLKNQASPKAAWWTNWEDTQGPWDPRAPILRKEALEAARQEAEADTRRQPSFFCETCGVTVNSTITSRNVHEASTMHLFNQKHEPKQRTVFIPEANRGFQMLERLGWEADKGKGLGKRGQGRVEPIPSTFKRSRRGIGGEKGAREKPRVTHFKPHVESSGAGSEGAGDVRLGGMSDAKRAQNELCWRNKRRRKEKKAIPAHAGETSRGRGKRLNNEQRKNQEIRNELDAGWAEIQAKMHGQPEEEGAAVGACPSPSPSPPLEYG